VPVCFPLIPPSTLIGDPNCATSNYLKRRGHFIIEGNKIFGGVQIRVNPNSGRGVLLDYFGCGIYDEILDVERMISQTISRGESLSLVMLRHRSAKRRLFKEVYELAFITLIDDRLLIKEMSRELANKGIGLFGSKYRFSKWLSEPNFLLRNQRPGKVMKQGFRGLEMVEEVLRASQPYSASELQFAFSK
jgi:hypothetical protein